jgi:hypothetical protein
VLDVLLSFQVGCVLLKDALKNGRLEFGDFFQKKIKIALSGGLRKN